MAAALRVLRRLREITGGIEQVLQEIRSPDARLACPEIDVRYRISHTSHGTEAGAALASRFKELAFTVVGKAWGLEAFFDGIGLDPIFVIADWLRKSGPEDFDDSLCVPGVLAVDMVCSLVAFDDNVYMTATEFQDETTILNLALLPCVSPVLGNDFVDAAAANARALFELQWAELTFWMRPPQRFLNAVWEPLLRSTVWWLGEGTSNGPPPRLLPMPESASACFGVMSREADDPCLFGTRGGGEPGGGFPRGEVLLPHTKVLGVGPMKSGSTLVWQALGAATQLPMGLDCDWVAHTDVTWRILQRRAPLWELLSSCSEELFKWELAKDPALTALAGHLAQAWPSISMHGEALKLYFVVRNPFDFVRSFVLHLGLHPDPGLSPEQQVFDLENHPKPPLFTRMKQLYFDVGREGLRYSGYLDALVQRWCLTVDEYLRCPARFALVRYEDFVAQPVLATRLLVEQLDLQHLWSDESTERVAQAARTRYQPQSSPPSDGPDPAPRSSHQRFDFQTFFGAAQFSRLRRAVAERALLLGYGQLLAALTLVGDEPVDPVEPIDVPSPPRADCGLR